jgi:CheY-like chemotaxis protein
VYRVLVVDDEPRLADSLVTIFQRAGYAAWAAYEGPTALKYCETLLPHVVLSDVIMPSMNGFELGRAIRQKFPQCRVVLFSGQAATTELCNQLGEGAEKFELLAKPIHPRKLLARIAEILAGPPSGAKPKSEAATAAGDS